MEAYIFVRKQIRTVRCWGVFRKVHNLISRNSAATGAMSSMMAIGATSACVTWRLWRQYKSSSMSLRSMAILASGVWHHKPWRREKHLSSLQMSSLEMVILLPGGRFAAMRTIRGRLLEKDGWQKISSLPKASKSRFWTKPNLCDLTTLGRRDTAELM